MVIYLTNLKIQHSAPLAMIVYQTFTYYEFFGYVFLVLYN